MASCKRKAKYTVVRDTQEKVGFWTFPASDSCNGTISRHMKTADYTLEGYEHLFLIERKRSTGEFAMNLFEARFERELCRLDAIEHAYLFLEFTWEDMVCFPLYSGIPKARWPRLKMTPQLLVKKYHEMRLEHPALRVEFVGARGREAASSLFKRIVERFPPHGTPT